MTTKSIIYKKVFGAHHIPMSDIVLPLDKLILEKIGRIPSRPKIEVVDALLNCVFVSFVINDR